MIEYIPKQKALDEIEELNIVSFYELNKHSMEAYQEIKMAISSLPPTDVRPVVRSQWKKNDNGTYFCEWCHSWIPEGQRRYANYCLYCGADMRDTKE